jgi:hypothetical protein
VTDDRPPVTVLLPTHEWSPVCEQLTAGLGPDDELLVICDSEADPVASVDPPEGVEVLVAGEPVGCSGKANALAYGMERATNDRFVWTDDDFRRGPAWLDRLATAGDGRGPVTVLPEFAGGGWWRLAEPALVLLLGSRNLLRERRSGAFPWGGGVVFHRDDLSSGVDALVADLRTCLSDDLVLFDHLEGCRRDTSLEATVHVDGDAVTVFRRLVRYLRVEHVHSGLGGEFAVSLVVAAAAVVYPLPVGVAATLLVAFAYASLGRPCWNALLAYPAVLSIPAMVAVGVAVDEFEWAGRRYRVNRVHDVDVLEPRW